MVSDGNEIFWFSHGFTEPTEKCISWKMLKTLRKFGLEYCDLPAMLWNICCMLRALTLNIDSRNERKIPFILYIFTILTAACHMYAFLFSTIWCIFWKYLPTDDTVTAATLLALLCASQMGTFKLIFMLFYEKKLKSLLDQYRILDGLVDPKSRMYQNVNKPLRLLKKKALCFWIIIVTNGIGYVLKPLFSSERKVVEEKQILYGLEPMLESPNYELHIFVMMGAAIYGVYPVAHITALIILLTGYTEAQMLALKEELLHIWEDAQNHYRIYAMNFNPGEISLNVRISKDKIINKYIKTKLEEIIKFHAINVGLIRQLEYIFREAIAIEFLLLMASFISALLGGLESTYIVMPFAIVQVTMDCLAGQRLIDASTKFENAVYDCKWENFDVSNRKTVLLILQMSQKNMMLSAGGVSTLNYDTLMRISKIVYSAYTTLRSTMKD